MCDGARSFRDDVDCAAQLLWDMVWFARLWIWICIHLNDQETMIFATNFAVYEFDFGRSSHLFQYFARLLSCRSKLVSVGLVDINQDYLECSLLNTCGASIQSNASIRVLQKTCINVEEFLSETDIDWITKWCIKSFDNVWARAKIGVFLFRMRCKKICSVNFPLLIFHEKCCTVSTNARLSDGVTWRFPFLWRV